MTEKDMTGILSPNDKGDNLNRPDFRGDIKINGVLYNLSAWTKQGVKGPFLSLQATKVSEFTL